MTRLVIGPRLAATALLAISFLAVQVFRRDPVPPDSATAAGQTMESVAAIPSFTEPQSSTHILSGYQPPVVQQAEAGKLRVEQVAVNEQLPVPSRPATLPAWAEKQSRMDVLVQSKPSVSKPPVSAREMAPLPEWPPRRDASSDRQADSQRRFTAAGSPYASPWSESSAGAGDHRLNERSSNAHAAMANNDAIESGRQGHAGAGRFESGSLANVSSGWPEAVAAGDVLPPPVAGSADAPSSSDRAGASVVSTRAGHAQGEQRSQVSMRVRTGSLRAQGPSMGRDVEQLPLPRKRSFVFQPGYKPK